MSPSSFLLCPKKCKKEESSKRKEGSSFFFFSQSSSVLAKVESLHIECYNMFVIKIKKREVNKNGTLQMEKRNT